jgi:Xaa-Pro aminopeptidase
MDYPGRQRQVRVLLAERRLSEAALLVTHLPNVQYLCGFTGSNAALLVGDGKPVLFTDGRYTQQAREESVGARVVISKGALLADAAKNLRKFKTLAFEAEHISAATLAGFRKLLPSGLRLRPASGLVEQLRMIKEPAELGRIRTAVQTASSFFQPLLAYIRAGVAETAVAAELEYAARRAGAEGMSFETIVASGPRSALPHGRASAAPVADGFVILDYGIRISGYCSDMTRTVYVGRADQRARGLYDAVLQAQQAAVAAVRPGVAVGDVDSTARKVLERAKLARYFTHSTGHGVGLEIHEAPRVAQKQKDVLQPGMVVTIEPGIYIPGEGGVRIEDMVVVTATGSEVLTGVTKELIQL